MQDFPSLKYPPLKSLKDYPQSLEKLRFKVSLVIVWVKNFLMLVNFGGAEACSTLHLGFQVLKQKQGEKKYGTGLWVRKIKCKGL